MEEPCYLFVWEYDTHNNSDNSQTLKPLFSVKYKTRRNGNA